VLGRLIEVVSGQSLDVFLDENVLGPLGMTATGFAVDDADRLATLYLANPATGRYLAAEAAGMGALAREAVEPTWLGGGGGLVSTAADYHRFTRMLLGRGEVDGVRILGSRTVDFMGANHLPGGLDLEQVGRPLFAEAPFHGVGFGLGFSVVLDPVAYKVPVSVGEIGWGGAASTAFWVDPVERITAMFFTQLLPSSAHPIRTQLRGLVYQALVD
jgi:CubicO group peptidase (beta-lactamase class C family)